MDQVLFEKLNVRPELPQNVGRSTQWMQSWIIKCAEHAEAFRASLLGFLHARRSHVLTLSVIGLSMALPVLLYLLLISVHDTLTAWQNDAFQISVYLKPQMNESEAQTLENQLKTWPEIKAVHMVSREAGLIELKRWARLEGVLDHLSENPLPVVLTIGLYDAYRTQAATEQLSQKLAGLPQVDNMDVDWIWLKQMQYLLAVAGWVIAFFSSILCLAVILVVFNSIRLMLKERDQEISLYALLGATDSYIRRPFLYGGALYGLFAACVGLFLAHSVLWVLQISIPGGAPFLGSVSVRDGLRFVLLSMVLGWLGARLSLLGQLKILKRKLLEV